MTISTHISAGVLYTRHQLALKLLKLYMQLKRTLCSSPNDLAPVAEDLPPGHADEPEAEPSQEGKNESILEDIRDGRIAAPTEDGALSRSIVGDDPVHVALHAYSTNKLGMEFHSLERTSSLLTTVNPICMS
jgi:hypothetical protein